MGSEDDYALGDETSGWGSEGEQAATDRESEAGLGDDGGTVGSTGMTHNEFISEVLANVPISLDEKTTQEVADYLARDLKNAEKMGGFIGAVVGFLGLGPPGAVALSALGKKLGKSYAENKHKNMTTEEQLAAAWGIVEEKAVTAGIYDKETGKLTDKATLGDVVSTYDEDAPGQDDPGFNDYMNENYGNAGGGTDGTITNEQGDTIQDWRTKVDESLTDWSNKEKEWVGGEGETTGEGPPGASSPTGEGPLPDEQGTGMPEVTELPPASELTDIGDPSDLTKIEGVDDTKFNDALQDFEDKSNDIKYLMDLEKLVGDLPDKDKQLIGDMRELAHKNLIEVATETNQKAISSSISRLIANGVISGTVGQTTLEGVSQKLQETVGRQSRDIDISMNQLYLNQLNDIRNKQIHFADMGYDARKTKALLAKDLAGLELTKYQIDSGLSIAEARLTEEGKSRIDAFEIAGGQLTEKGKTRIDDYNIKQGQLREAGLEWRNRIKSQEDIYKQQEIMDLYKTTRGQDLTYSASQRGYDIREDIAEDKEKWNMWDYALDVGVGTGIFEDWGGYGKT